jgi:hypothetical protein
MFFSGNFISREIFLLDLPTKINSSGRKQNHSSEVKFSQMREHEKFFEVAFYDSLLIFSRITIDILKTKQLFSG